MAEGLSAFLEEVQRRAWRWGEHDCFLIMCDWIALRRGFDPGSAYRGAYDTERGAQRIMVAAGGLRCIVRSVLAGRLGEVDRPREGDVGVVRAPVACLADGRTAWRPACAIATSSEEWAFKTPDRGIMMATHPFVRALDAWRV